MYLKDYESELKGLKIEMTEEHRKVLMDIIMHAFANKANYVKDIETTEKYYRQKFEAIKKGSIAIRDLMWIEKQAISCKTPPATARIIYDNNRDWIKLAINSPKVYHNEHVYVQSSNLKDFFND